MYSVGILARWPTQVSRGTSEVPHVVSMDLSRDSLQVCIALTTLRKPDLHLPQTPSDARMNNFTCPN
jgi:hypothetical protein